MIFRLKTVYLRYKKYTFSQVTCSQQPAFADQFKYIANAELFTQKHVWGNKNFISIAVPDQWKSTVISFILVVLKLFLVP